MTDRAVHLLESLRSLLEDSYRAGRVKADFSAGGPMNPKLFLTASDALESALRAINIGNVKEATREAKLALSVMKRM